MKNKTLTFIWASLCLISVPFTLFASNAPKSTPTVATAQQMLNNQGMLFQENRGQLADPSGNALPEIKYYCIQGDVTVYCENNKLSFVFTQVIKSNSSRETNPLLVADATSEVIKINASRMEMELIGANANPRIIASDRQVETANYFLAHTGDNGISNINSNKQLTYINIYPNIDMVLVMAGHGLEYSFNVHPGGKVSDIKLHWNGTDNTEALTNGGISYSNGLGNLTESAPISFIDGNNVGSSIIKQGNSRSFNVETYDKSKELVIDPSLSWATYYGGGGVDVAQGIALDASGYIYIVGNTTSKSGIATKGAYSTLYTGNYNAFLAKFSSAGALLWATYYGGSSYEYNIGISIDGSGYVYIDGSTDSKTGIASSGAYQTSFAGAHDVFLAKFSSSGSRIWGTYYGGSADDYPQGISTDASGNVYIGGGTASGAGIATSGAYQTSFAGGAGDAFLAKFSSSGSLSWATYFGGADYDQGYSLKTDGSDVYITGSTASTSGIATSGAYQTSNNGSGGLTYYGDVFLAKFSGSGSLTWATYYGGSGVDIAEGISTDASGNVYITGLTTSTSSIATSGAYQTSYAGGASLSFATGDAFLAKFSSGGSLTWATYFGGSGDEDGGRGVVTDKDGNVYITGQTHSSSGIATSGAYQSAYGGSGDAYLAQFSGNGSLQWATYYGGSGTDAGRKIVIDAAGNLYMDGSTNSKSNIATSGSYQSSNKPASDEAFLAKFYFPGLAPIGTGSGLDNNENIVGRDFLVVGNINVYPNPFSSATNIQFVFAKDQQISAEVWSIDGRLVKTLYNGNVTANMPCNYLLDCAAMKPGIYFVKVMSEGHVDYRKIELIR